MVLVLLDGHQKHPKIDDLGKMYHPSSDSDVSITMMHLKLV